MIPLTERKLAVRLKSDEASLVESVLRSLVMNDIVWPSDHDWFKLAKVWFRFERFRPKPVVKEAIPVTK